MTLNRSGNNRVKSKATILIATSSIDNINVKVVADILTERSYNTVMYEGDRVLRGEHQLSIRLHPKTGLVATYQGRSFSSNSIAAAWLRRPNIFFARRTKETELRRLNVSSELAGAQRTLWDLIPHHTWLNAPGAMDRAEQKIAQLDMARRVGFVIPDTVVSNQWRDVHQLPKGATILKTFRGEAYDERLGTMNQVPTTVFTNNKEDPLAEGLPFPAIWQPAIPKKREWRITIVGGKSFDAAIYTTKNAKDDWRIHQFTSDVEFRREPFPTHEKEKCFRLLKVYGLRYGAFDFIEKPDGTIVFLEVNTNGQYRWLEEQLDLPISEAIATELIAITEGGK